MNNALRIGNILSWTSIGTLCGYWIREWKEKLYPKTNFIIETNTDKHETPIHLPEGFLCQPTTKVFVRPAFTTCMNFKTKTPDWVAEKLTAASNNGVNGERKHASFKPDMDVPVQFRATNADYWDSGWSRGHLAASASHKLSQENQDCTFLLNSNIVPQDLSMNGCDWNRLEVLVRDLTKEHPNGTIYVLSGPIWLPEFSEHSQRLFSKNKSILHEVIGINQVHVPTHMFKVIRLDDGPQSASVAFIIPNRPIAEESPIESFKVSMSEIERHTGIDLQSYETNTDLCSISRCDKPTNRRMLGWRHYGLIDMSANVQELRKSVMDAVDAGFVDGDNFLIPKVIRDRMRDLILGEDPSSLFPDNPRYRDAVQRGFETFRRKSVDSIN